MRYLPLLFIVAFLVGVLALATEGGRRIDDDAAACAERGGVQVKVYGGFKCIRAEVIE